MNESTPPHLKSNIRLYYERSAETWIQDALSVINKESGSDGGLVADYRGSRDGKQAILYGTGVGVEKGENSMWAAKARPFSGILCKEGFVVAAITLSW